MKMKPRILIAQSTLQDCQLVESALAQERAEGVDITCSPTLDNALKELADSKFSVILLSWSFPSNSETRFAIRMLRESSGAPVLPLRTLLRRPARAAASGFDRSARETLARTLKICLNDASQYGAPEAAQAADNLSKLKASEERYALAIEGAKDGIWDWDLTLNSVYYSQQWRAMLGLSQEDLTGTPQDWLSRVHPDDVVRLQRSLDNYLTRRSACFRCEYRIARADNYYLWVLSRGRALWNDAGDAYRIVGSQVDISYHKRLEETLAKEKEQAEVVVESMSDAVITTDLSGRIIDFNPEAEKLTGWSAAAAKDRPIFQICRIVDSVTREPLEQFSAIATERAEVATTSSYRMLISKQGAETAIDDSVAPIRDRSGAIVGTVWVIRDISVERDRAEQLVWQASHDPLTGLANRQHFVERLAIASHEPDCSHVVCYLDLDHFKIVNDTCGHAAGDELLRQVSALLNASIRQSDLIARLGGDEFGLIIYNCQLESAHTLACKICDAVQKFRFLWGDKVFSIGVSIGLVAIPLEGAIAAKLMSLADAACYAAKNKGRNQVQVYSEENQDVMQMSADFEWFSRITQAMEDNRFCLYSQEIRPCDSTQETIHEILLRLVDSKTGRLMPPLSFIPPAERYDLMPKLDRWTIARCFQQLEHADTSKALYSINLSGDTLNDDGFETFLQEKILDFHIDPYRICFEITETTAIANLAQVAATVLNLKKLGFRFALDDFGSGMSSFVYLKQLPVDYLKIDGSLVLEINRDEIALATLKSINDIGHIMGLATVAEYVADAEILRTVQALNIDYAQGFAISKPKPFEPATRTSRLLDAR